MLYQRFLNSMNGLFKNGGSEICELKENSFYLTAFYSICSVGPHYSLKVEFGLKNFDRTPRLTNPVRALIALKCCISYFLLDKIEVFTPSLFADKDSKG